MQSFLVILMRLTGEIEKIAGGYDRLRLPPASLSERVVDHEIYIPSQWSLTQPLAIMPGRQKL